MAGCDGEKVVTMMDVLKEQQEFEDDANAVLGASDDKNCTYSKGYVRRQAIYACLTCCPEAKTDQSKRAGMCLACSLNCHESHDLVELYTKRNFRCDCGNPKFSSHPCNFTPDKCDLNYENKYNQNFSGLYCVCHRPYPDPEATEEEEMIQCIVCEDWLHEKHLEASIPYNDQYAEMICKDCMEDNDFLHDYSDFVINTVDKEIEHYDPDLDVDISIINNSTSQKKQGSMNGVPEYETEKNGEVPNKTEETKEAMTSNDEKPDKDVDETEKKPDANGDDKEDTQNEKEKKQEDKGEELTKPIEDEKTDSVIGDLNNGQNEPTKNSEAGAETKSSAESESNVENGTESTENKTETETKPDSDSVEKMEEDKLLQDELEPKQNNDLGDSSTTNEDDTSKQKNESSVTDNKKDNVDTESTENANQTEEKTGMDSIDKTIDSSAEKDAATEVTNDVEIKDVNSDKEKQENKETKRKLSTDDAEDDQTVKKQKLEVKTCTRPRGVKRVYKGATFWPSNFRQKLCTCNECISMYKDLAVLFLMDPEDTVTAYEALGKERTEGGPSSQYEKGLQALSSLDRVQQINALTEYNKMRDKLLDFLQSFKDRKEIVKEEDIKAFFAGMKPKREPDGVYFCR